MNECEHRDSSNPSLCDQSDPWSLILICLLIYDSHLPAVTKTHKMDDTLRHLHQYIVDF